MRTIVHITASRFFGGPERQILGLAEELRTTFRTIIVSFDEEGLSREFLDHVDRRNIEAFALNYDTPRLVAAQREIVRLLKQTRAEAVLCHGYKAGLLGLLAARRVGIPAIAVSRGWTGESRRVRLYESLDRRVLRYMDRVICVSQAQAAKVRAAGVRQERITVIHNAIRSDRFDPSSRSRRKVLESLFNRAPRIIIGAAGRLSPEKGFDVLVEAAARVLRLIPDVGFVVFGDGDCAQALRRQIAARGIEAAFILGGFRSDLDDLFPCFDLYALPSHTEGLPNVLLEACASGVPVVATNVGGTCEVISDGQTGLIVPPNDPAALTKAMVRLLTDEALYADMKAKAPMHVARTFSFVAQADAYQEVFRSLFDKSELARTCTAVG